MSYDLRKCNEGRLRDVQYFEFNSTKGATVKQEDLSWGRRKKFFPLHSTRHEHGTLKIDMSLMFAVKTAFFSVH